MKRSSFLCILFGFHWIIVLFLLNGCFSNPILTQKIYLSEEEEKKLQKQLDRNPNKLVYESNLKNFEYPTEVQLMQEANFKKKVLFKENVKLISDWISKEIPKKQRYIMSKNCEIFLNKFSDKFPLNEKNFPCAPWWLEKKQYLRNKKIQEIANKKTIFVINNKKNKTLSDYKNSDFFYADKSLEFLSNKDLNKIIYQAKEEKKNTCYYKNVVAALIFRLDRFIPKIDAYENIENLYQNFENCFNIKDEYFERINIKISMLRIIFNQEIEKSEAPLKKNLELENPQEKTRTFFWLGYLFQEKKPLGLNNQYWNTLTQENPLSIFSIIAAEQEGIDPTALFVEDTQIQVQHRVEGGWNEINLGAYIFEALQSLHFFSSAERLANYLAKDDILKDPSVILYWAINQNKIGKYHDSILTLGRYFKYLKKIQISKSLLKIQYPISYLPEILSSSSGVDPILILSLIRQESAFDERAFSSANAKGLMQVLLSTAQTIKHNIKSSELYDPLTNIEIGSNYLERLFKKFGGQAEYALAAYNAGPTHLEKWRLRIKAKNILLFSEFIPFKETRNYVTLILRNYYWYNRLLSEINSPITNLMMKKSSQSTWKPSTISMYLRKIDPI